MGILGGKALPITACTHDILFGILHETFAPTPNHELLEPTLEIQYQYQLLCIFNIATAKLLLKFFTILFLEVIHLSYMNEVVLLISIHHTSLTTAGFDTGFFARGGKS